MSDKRYLESESLKEAMWKNFYKEEDKWECTPEANFLEADGGEPRHWFQLGFSAGLDAVVSADAVPQEMSARELLLTEERMIREDADAYREYAPLAWNRKVDEAVAYAERWAREHPEERSEE